MANIKVSVINSCIVLTDAQIAPVVEALQKQVSGDFAPVWGVDADLTFVPTGQTPASGSWWLTVFDTSDQAGALGYHDLTPDGLPLGKVFAKSDIENNSSWSITMSHELLEMLGDPDINLVATVESGTSMRLYSYEVCDACEDDSFGYPIDGVSVSDFVYPPWFESFRTQGSTQFDKQNKITSPFQLLKGGYIGYFDVSSGTGWQQLLAPGDRPSQLARPRVGSRRERRMTERDQWTRSDPTPVAK
jgi:hypothetical protein